MEQRPVKKPSGSVNYFRVLAGGYLLYLAFKIIRDYVSGDESVPVLGLLATVIFIGFGGWLLLREWKAYQYGAAHKDDPESWSLAEGSETEESEAEEAKDKDEEPEDESKSAGEDEM